ncbi:hypothetical protein [Microbacterium sp.]|uniref:hypothetical protein n=1 Tax=Microbacterium sp. TaxID=51671 RepID=UPI0039E2DBA1
MSQPDTATPEPKNMSLLIKGSIWIAIGALVAAAIVCVVWVLIGDQDGLIGRAFLTILLLAAFAGVAILEAGLAPNRPDWLALASMVSWIIALIAGAFKIWLPDDGQYLSGGERFFHLLLIIGILQLALVHVRLFTPAARRFVTTFTRVIYIATIVFLIGLVGMLVFYLTFPHSFDYGDLYGRILVALTILVAVGTTLIPLLNALFAPKKAPRAVVQTPGVAAPAAWPTFADGRTPLPVMPDGSPDWNAYYTGVPTATQYAQAPVPQVSFPVPQAAPVPPVSPAGPAATDPTAPSAPIAPPVVSPVPSVPQAAPDPTVPPVVSPAPPVVPPVPQAPPAMEEYPPAAPTPPQ